MKRKAFKKAVAVVSALALVCTVIPAGQAQAKKKIKLNKTSATIKVGKSIKLKLKNAKKKVSWKSSNKKIATVSSKGKVTGKQAGNVKITAKSAGKKYICRIKVKQNSKPKTTQTPEQETLGSATPGVSQTPKVSGKPSATGSASPSQTPAYTKKPLTQSTISPADSSAPGETNSPSAEESKSPTGTDEPSQSQSPGSSYAPTQSPASGGTSSQSPEDTDTPSQSPGVTNAPIVSQSPGSSYAPTQSPASGGTSSQSPEDTDSPVQTPVTSNGPIVSQSPVVSSAPSQSPSATTKPTQAPSPTQEPDYEDPTLEISEIALGMSLGEVRGIMGLEDRVEATPQGYTGYIFNPDMSYEDYILVYMDNEKVVGWATMSTNYSYGNIVSIGAAASSLNSFNAMTSYAYKAGYLYKGANEYVMAFSDHQGDSTIYAVQIFSKTDGNGNAVELDKLIKPENLTYNDEINANMADQMADWVNTFRCNRGLNEVDYYAAGSETGADAAQKHSEDMAANNNVSSTGSNGTTYRERFEANYREIANMYEGDTLGKGENNASHSPDAFGFVIWWIDDSDAPASRDNICRSTAIFDEEEWPLSDYYLCTGFAYNSAVSDKTFATLDFFY